MATAGTCPGRSSVYPLQNPDGSSLIIDATWMNATFTLGQDLQFSGNCNTAVQRAGLPENITGCQDLRNCYFTSDFDGRSTTCMLEDGQIWTAQECTGVYMQPIASSNTYLSPVSCSDTDVHGTHIGFPYCGVQITYPMHDPPMPEIDTTAGIAVAHPQLQCYKTAWDPTFQFDCCTGKRDSWAYCDPSWCPSDPEGNCAGILETACKGPSSIGVHKFLTLDATANGGVDCAVWYNSVMDGIQSCALLLNPADRTACLLNYQTQSSVIDTEVRRYCGIEGEGNFSGECACIHAYVNCGDTSGSTAGSEECLLGQHVPGTPAQSGAKRYDIYCAPGSEADPTKGTALYSGAGGVCSASAPSPGNPNGWPPAINRLVGTTGGPSSADALVPSNFDPAGPSVGAGGDSGDFVGSMPVHCWHPACQHDTSKVFKDIAKLSIPCPAICAQESSGNNINVAWARDKWSEMGVNTLACQFPGTQQALATPFQVASECTSVAIAIPPNYTASIPLSFTNVSSETHANFQTIGWEAFSSLNPRVEFSGDTVGSLSTNAWQTLMLEVDSSNLTPGSSYEGFLTIQATDGVNGQAYVPFQFAVVPAGYGVTLPLSCSPEATAQAQVPQTVNMQNGVMLNNPWNDVQKAHGMHGMHRMQGMHSRLASKKTERTALSSLDTESIARSSPANSGLGLFGVLCAAAALVAVLVLVVLHKKSTSRSKSKSKSKFFA